MRVLMAGGGTAGHVEPALNTADELRRRDASHHIVMLGTPDGLETRLVPDRGYELELIPKVPFPRRPNAAAARFPTDFRRAVKAARQVIARHDIDVVVGFGGFVATPAYVAARRRVPLVIHEANARAGLANRLGRRWTPYRAAAVEGALPGAEVVGMPLRASIANLDRASRRDEAARKWGFDPGRPTVLVFGGSQGARSLNEVVLQAGSGWIEKGFQVLHAVGTLNDDQLAQGRAIGSAYQAVPYLDQMDVAYSLADLALCRSGAMTCAEVAAVGLPAIFVPLPVGNGEQRLNAEPMVRAGGAVVFEQSELTAELLGNTAAAILADSSRREKMGAAATECGTRDAAARLATLIERAAAKGQTI